MGLPKIIHPTFEVVIPSLKKKIPLRPMTVKEEKILLMAKESIKNESNIGEMYHAIKQVISNCIPEDVDVNTLATFDIDFLFLKLRSISVSNIVNLNYQEGKKEFKVVVDLNTVEMKWPEEIPSFIKMAENSGIKLKYPSAKLYDSEVFRDPTSLPTQLFDALIVECLDSYFQEDKVYPFHNETPENILEFVNNLDIKTYNELKLYASNLPTLYHEVDYGGKTPLVMSTLTDFFQF